ncbi:hypothetical protein PASE110613_15195 [Paenibacillus sediminis]|uniref:Uncharacterized protein n=1 Tax=Paenibacillus sediminis TaxID=664909 RepID=A0ABS4H433_9BACL|nr:hypothetical protein [Paenibacillus sediminis]MBP1937308.1 hypothetical protein [Paenibacillus sediminis]
MIFIDNKKVLGIGQVTEKGVEFKELFYSCDIAIKKRWFEQARVNGPWIAFVIFDQNTPDKLLLIEPFNHEPITCYAIKRITESALKLERYFQSIQQLKTARSYSKSFSKYNHRQKRDDMKKQ